MPSHRANRVDSQFEKDSAWLVGLLAQAQTRRFYGKITIVMEEGQIRRVVKEESLRPPEGRTTAAG